MSREVPLPPGFIAVEISIVCAGEIITTSTLTPVQDPNKPVGYFQTHEVALSAGQHLQVSYSMNTRARLDRVISVACVELDTQNNVIASNELYHIGNANWHAGTVSLRGKLTFNISIMNRVTAANYLEHFWTSYFLPIRIVPKRQVQQ